jgi:hypothetical protein
VIWSRVKNCLEVYLKTWAGARLLGLGKTPGTYLCVSFIVLILLGFLAARLTGGHRSLILALCWVGAVYYIVDALLVHTTIVYITRDPADPLRSVILSFAALINIVLAFAVVYAVHGQRFLWPPLTHMRSIFFSAATATTFGDSVIQFSSVGAQLIVMLQLLTTLYFLAVVVAIVIGWAPPSKPPSPPTGDKSESVERVI